MLWDLCCGKRPMLCNYAVGICKSLLNDSVTVIRPLHTRCIQSYSRSEFVPLVYAANTSSCRSLAPMLWTCAVATRKRRGPTDANLQQFPMLWGMLWTKKQTPSNRTKDCSQLLASVFPMLPGMPSILRITDAYGKVKHFLCFRVCCQNPPMLWGYALAETTQFHDQIIPKS